MPRGWASGAARRPPSLPATPSWTRSRPGGVAVMELIARELKAMGLYIARSLSFDGVEYEALRHPLTADDIAIWDAWADAYQLIHQNLRAALDAVGISEDGQAQVRPGRLGGDVGVRGGEAAVLRQPPRRPEIPLPRGLDPTAIWRRGAPPWSRSSRPTRR